MGTKKRATNRTEDPINYMEFLSYEHEVATYRKVARHMHRNPRMSLTEASHAFGVKPTSFREWLTDSVA